MKVGFIGGMNVLILIHTYFLFFLMILLIVCHIFYNNFCLSRMMSTKKCRTFKKSYRMKHAVTTLHILSCVWLIADRK